MKRFRFFPTALMRGGTAKSAGANAYLQAYLLGELPPQDRDALEERYFRDHAVHEEVLAAEDLLVDAYLQGELTPGQRTRFQEFFLRSEGRIEKLRLAEAAAQQKAPRISSNVRWLRASFAAGLVAPIVLAFLLWGRFPPPPIPEKAVILPPPDSSKTGVVALMTVKWPETLPLHLRLDQEISAGSLPGTLARFRAEQRVVLAETAVEAGTLVTGVVITRKTDGSLIVRLIRAEGPGGTPLALQATGELVSLTRGSQYIAYPGENRLVSAATLPVSKFDDPRKWIVRDGVMRHQGAAFLTYAATPSVGVYTFTVIRNGSPIRWFTRFTDEQNYDWFELKPEGPKVMFLESGQMIDGRRQDVIRMQLPAMPEHEERIWTIRVEVYPSRILLYQRATRAGFRLLASLTPRGSQSKGKFGFLLRDGEEVALSNFEFATLRE